MSAPGRISPSMPRTPGWRSQVGTIPFPPHPHKTQKTTPHGVVLKCWIDPFTARWQRPPYTRRSGPPDPQRPSTQIPSHSPPSVSACEYSSFSLSQQAADRKSFVKSGVERRPPPGPIPSPTSILSNYTRNPVLRSTHFIHAERHNNLRNHPNCGTMSHTKNRRRCNEAGHDSDT